jgi:hypothetical protein
LSASSAHWAGCSANSRIACASCGVDPAGQQVHDELRALRGGQPVSPGLHGEQLADQVVAGSGPPGLEQFGHVVEDLGDRPLDVAGVGSERPDIELPLHPG